MSAFECGPWMMATGGESQGGGSTLVPPSGMFAYGGESQGGEAGVGVGMSGVSGQSQGGEATQEGESPCGPVPTLSSVSGVATAFGDVTLGYPLGSGVPGLLLAWIYQQTNAADFSFPPGWTLLGTQASGGGEFTLGVAYLFVDGSDTSPVTITGNGFLHMWAGLTPVLGSGVPFIGTFGSGGNNPIDVPPVDVGVCPSLLLAGVGHNTFGSSFDDEGGYAELLNVPAQTPLAAFTLTPAGPGLSGAGPLFCADGDVWVAVHVVCPPP